MTVPQSLIDRGIMTPDGKLTPQAWRRATQDGPYAERQVWHFVGFKDDRYSAACRVFGKPDFIHRFWDVRAMHEACEGDVVVFASGDEHSEPTPFAFDDSANF